MNLEANSVIKINTTLDIKFFKCWLSFLTPYHHLTDGEINIASYLIYKRYTLSKVINDDVILDNITLGNDVKREVRELYNLSYPHLALILKSLKTKEIIVDGKLNRRYIPRVKEGATEFKLLLKFQFNDVTGDNK